MSRTEGNGTGTVYALRCRRKPASLMTTYLTRAARDMRPTVSIRREIIRELVPTRDANHARIHGKQDGHDEVTSVRRGHRCSRSVIER